MKRASRRGQSSLNSRINILLALPDTTAAPVNRPTFLPKARTSRYAPTGLVRPTPAAAELPSGDAAENPRSMSAPPLALIGCGAVAEAFYVPALRKRPEVAHSLIVIDPDRSRAQALRERLGAAAALTDYREVLHRISGAMVLTPHHLHCPMALELARHGVAVLCEEPLADSAAEGGGCGRSRWPTRPGRSMRSGRRAIRTACRSWSTRRGGSFRRHARCAG